MGNKDHPEVQNESGWASPTESNLGIYRASVKNLNSTKVKIELELTQEPN